MLNLVIAEKPSVAQSIAKVLGCTGRQDGYLEGNGYLVSWCVGHLIELAEPEGYDSKYEKWKKEDLPIIPVEFKYQVSASTKKQFQTLRELMNRSDVTVITNACDAGREGELIFRLVYDKAGCKKPMKRLWISSMEDEAIREGFKNLEDGKAYDKLYEAALCRERADWLVGINATRFFTCSYGQTLNVGRVMTPTLALAVEREAKIRAFKPEDFYQVQIETLDGKLTFKGERLSDKNEAEAIADNCKTEGKVVVTKAETKEKLENAPLLYDLTSLQRDANKKLGYTAQQTLDYAQSLYEKKLLTYPRTDSRFLTDDMGDKAAEIFNIIQEAIPEICASITCDCKKLLNSKKVSDHHAIIPTEVMETTKLEELPEGEKKILQLVAVRFMESIAEPAKYNITEGEVSCLGKFYSYKCKHFAELGWRNVDRIFESEVDIEEGEDWFAFSPGEEITITGTSVKSGKTTPPKSYTEDTLLSAMEKAGEEDIPDEAERKGLGTPATRAGVIEKLVRIGFLERRGDKKTKYLVPTHKGETLITVIPQSIQSASMTAEWEQKLLQIERSDYDADAFMSEIAQMVQTLIDTYRIVPDAEVLMHPVYDPIGKCPCCGSDVVEKSKGFFCENNSCKFALWKDNRFFDSLSKKITKQIATQLIQNGNARLKKCRSIKTGKTYDATVVLTTSDNGKAQFSLDFTKGGK
ncbi:DNA topoisomerase 3 [Butyrivibrio sp. LC3010]|uniref:DNA topoisomerase 3 n=1 Tax=Butyrivibrio sp. LC3010 TaxID=1280680 RepID=UPI0003FD384A|nr:DNA topoisomerase 3 [Butyrivibrio sp. LC3010]